jgi:hypothetical protein
VPNASGDPAIAARKLGAEPLINPTLLIRAEKGVCNVSLELAKDEQRQPLWLSVCAVKPASSLKTLKNIAFAAGRLVPGPQAETCIALSSLLGVPALDVRAPDISNLARSTSRGASQLPEKGGREVIAFRLSAEYPSGSSERP